ncbi:VanZ family protein [Clostridium sp. C2-6-12]|uniref:VanZ family protein n=1 Tax=Clostridium sp. C2-6-12 TaxID=2698832 RepID=UPI00136FD286|nr:VanZ family protein [Clostridium sp. C2-6-12]
MKKIAILLCLFWMGFIFYMSSIDAEISHQESNKIVNIIKNTETNPQINAKNEIINEKNIKEEQMKQNQLDYIIRKNAHAFMYMILAVLVSGAFFANDKRGKDAIGNILLICLLYGVIDEFHQSFIPGRTSLVSDILIDFLGSLVGLTIFYLAYYKHIKISNFKSLSSKK